MSREIPPPEGVEEPPAWRGEADWIFFYRAWQGGSVFKARCAGLEEGGWGRRLVFRLGRIKGSMVEEEAAWRGRFFSLPGRFLYCQVTDIRRGAGEVVLSRRLALDRIRSLTWSNLSPGLTLPAVVDAVYPGRGALVDVGGVRALLPPAEMAWGWVADPRRVVQPRQLLTVRVLTVDRAAGKATVSLKALQEDPWLTLADRYRENARYLATVTGTAGDAVFVSFEPGVAGCCRGVRDSPPPDRPGRREPAMDYLLAELMLVLVVGVLVELYLLSRRVRPAGEPTAADHKGAEAGFSGTGTFLGGGPDGPVILSDEEVNAHVLVLGATGSGKTTTLLRFLESAVQRGIALIVVDGKADPGLAARVASCVAACGRKFRHFDMTRPLESIPYNPLSRGSTLELRDRLMECSDWSEPHYKFASARYLTEGIALVRAAGEGRDLPSLVRALEPHHLALLARRLEKEERFALNDLIDRCGKEATGLLNRLAVYAPREMETLLRDDPEAIDLGEVWEKGEVALFSLDSMSYPEQARLVGRLFVLDLKAAAGAGRRVCT